MVLEAGSLYLTAVVRRVMASAVQRWHVAGSLSKYAEFRVGGPTSLCSECSTVH